MIVICKKWHVAKRLVERIRQVTDLPAVDYLFNEDSTPLPDLGGIQTTLEKRTRHRRALVRMLFDYWETDQLMVCIDPANVDLMQDFYADRSNTRLLEVDCEFTDEYLIGHARRVGLAGDRTTQETIDRLMPTIRYDVKFESDRIRDADFEGFYRLREVASLRTKMPCLWRHFLVFQMRKRARSRKPNICLWIEAWPIPTTTRISLPAFCAAKFRTRPCWKPSTRLFSMIFPRRHRCMCW